MRVKLRSGFAAYALSRTAGGRWAKRRRVITVHRLKRYLNFVPLQKGESWLPSEAPLERFSDEGT